MTNQIQLSEETQYHEEYYSLVYQSYQTIGRDDWKELYQQVVDSDGKVVVALRDGRIISGIKIVNVGSAVKLTGFFSVEPKSIKHIFTGILEFVDGRKIIAILDKKTQILHKRLHRIMVGDKLDIDYTIV